MKCRSRTGVARRKELSTVRIDDRSADREAHTHSGGLGGEEGIEQPIHMLSLNPNPRVLYRDEYLIGVVAMRPNCDLARPVGDGRHGFHAVHYKIDDHLLYLDSVDQDQWEIGCKFEA